MPYDVGSCSSQLDAFEEKLNKRREWRHKIGKEDEGANVEQEVDDMNAQREEAQEETMGQGEMTRRKKEEEEEKQNTKGKERMEEPHIRRSVA